MKHTKLWSALLAAVLLCACVVGLLITGAGATDTRIPAATTIYTVGTNGDTIADVLKAASQEEWAKGAVLEIQFSGTDTSSAAEADEHNERSSHLFFGQPTIFRADDTKLPIVIRGTDADRAATIKTAKGEYACANDYVFTDLTFNGGTSGNVVKFFAGSGNVVFENANVKGIDGKNCYTYYYGDNFTMDAFYGWSANQALAYKNEDGLMESSLTFGKGCTINSSTTRYLAAVGSTLTNDTLTELAAAADAESPKRLTENQVASAIEAANSVEYMAGDLVSQEAPFRPSTSKASLILDAGTAGKTTRDYGVPSPRQGVSPVKHAVLELLTGNPQYVVASDDDTALEIYVGDTDLIIRAGITQSGDTGCRFLRGTQHIGDFSVEIHEDDPDYRTHAPWIRGTSDSGTSMIYGDYHFLMTGGEIGNKDKAGNFGYWGAPEATGEVINEIRGGQLWRFYGAAYKQYSDPHVDFTATLAEGKTLNGKAHVRNIITGGVFGDEGSRNDADAGHGFYGGIRYGTAGPDLVVVNEISGGTFYGFYPGNSVGNNQLDTIYNVISGSPVFECNYFGYYRPGAVQKIVNVIDGTPDFKETVILGTGPDGTAVEIENHLLGGTFAVQVNGGNYGGTTEKSITNYLDGATFTQLFYGGSNSEGNDYSATITNEVISGKISHGYYGAGYNGAKTVTNNFYGGEYIGTNKMGGAYNAKDAAAEMDIINNFYGGIFGGSWSYGGNRSGPAGTITNSFYSGAENPKRNAADPDETMHENGTIMRDRIVLGGGNQLATFHRNVVGEIVNNFAGGCWTKATGSSTEVRFYGGLRYGTVENITNNYISGTYYMTYGGNTRGELTGTLTNNVGTSTAAEKPELVFTSSFNAGNNIDAGVDFPELIDAALAKQAAGTELTASDEAYIALGEGFIPGASCKIVNNFNYGTFEGEVRSGGFADGVPMLANEIENTVSSDCVFEATFVGGAVTVNGGYFRSESVVNNVTGAAFGKNFIGGSSGAGAVTVNVTNNLTECSFNQTSNTTVYMGGANSGTVVGIIDSTLTDVNGGAAYIHCASSCTTTAPDGAEYAVKTLIDGGSFRGVWGVGGGESAVLNGNSYLRINDGEFRGFSDAFPYSVSGASRNGKVNGNCVTEIYGGKFYAMVTGGVTAADVSYAKAVNGNVTLNIYGGEFYGEVNANGAFAEEGIVATQSQVVINAGENEIKIGKKTNIQADSIVGTLKLNQTEGWLNQTYLTAPAGSVVTVTEAQDVFGTYSLDDLVILRGNSVSPYGTTLILAERVGVRFLFDKALIDSYGAEFTYKVTMASGEEPVVLAEGGFEDLVEYEGYYSFVMSGVGLKDFNTMLTLSGAVVDEQEFYIVALAQAAQAAWTAPEFAEWKEFAEAVEEFYLVYSDSAAPSKTPDAVNATLFAERGAAGAEDASVQLLMSDAVGIRLSVTLAAAPTNPKIFVNGTEIADVALQGVTVDETTGFVSGYVDLFFAHKFLADTFTVSVESDAGVHLTCTGTIEALAYALSQDAENANKDNAAALLYYIQQAVDCIA